jgi:hypothetical protein
MLSFKGTGSFQHQPAGINLCLRLLPGPHPESPCVDSPEGYTGGLHRSPVFSFDDSQAIAWQVMGNLTASPVREQKIGVVVTAHQGENLCENIFR